MGKIEIDLQRALNQAEQLEDVADRLKILTSHNLSNTISGLEQAWRSESSTKFCRKGRNVENDLSVIVRDLRKTANTIRSTARAIYAAEKRAEEIARRREFNNG